jgi:hypothetical protein
MPAGCPCAPWKTPWCWPASRRLLRPTGAPPLATIRSLAYFLPAIDEVLDLTISQDYFHYLRSKIQPFLQTSNTR